MVVAALALLAGLASAAPDPCADPPSALDVPALGGAPARPVDNRALLTLRSFGAQHDEFAGDPAFSVSPDGRSAALLLRRPVPDTNSFCQSLVVVDIATGTARVIDRGGALIRQTVDHGGYLSGLLTGFPQTITPAWSPDGQTLAYLKSVDGPAQIWLVDRNGGGARVLSREQQEVTAVTWSNDGNTILFRTDRALRAALANIDAEGLSGWHYDDRVFPTNRPKPFPTASDPASLDFAIDIHSQLVRSASATERDALGEAMVSNRLRATLPGGTTALLSSRPLDPSAFLSRSELQLDIAGRTYRCKAEACRKSQAAWLSRNARSVLFLTRSGWGNGDQTFYRWFPRTGRVEQLATTRDTLTGCRLVADRLLCARQEAVTPRRLAWVDPVTGVTRPVFNPNTDYDRLRSGKVERIFVTSANGSRTFADIMLPPDFQPGRRYPMVVVQYQSRGFLSGGTNNEFAIPPLASAGMIVLSFQRPRDIYAEAVPAPKSFSEAARLNNSNWADRRNVHSALMAAIDQVIARGIVDERRIGITGLSDGLATAAFALVNSHRFAAVALSGCCEEPIALNIYQGPKFARDMQAGGVPKLSAPDVNYWRDYSVAQNASRIHTPILIQSVDNEYLLSLPTYTALKEQGAPVDLYVFPDENHSKWQPAHRLAVWDRTLRWFSFWFDLPLPSQTPLAAAERARWSAWRSRITEAPVARPEPAPTPPHR